MSSPASPRLHLPLTPSATAGQAFDSALQRHGQASLRRSRVTTLQVNLGKRCNLACLHCHVDAGPNRTEMMQAETVADVLSLLARSPQLTLLDLTGGAPELSPHFRELVAEARRLKRRVIDRCNLAVLLEPGQESLAEFLAEQQVEVVASLPCYSAANVDKQRGKHAFERSIAALRLLNRLGYGRRGSALQLTLVYNPVGPALPPPQAQLEADYRARLQADFGIEFHHLVTITNMPIARFAKALARDQQLSSYDALLRERFNAATLPGLMCRSLLSVGWDGRLYDCDFNQMQGLPLPAGASMIGDLDSIDQLEHQPIAVADHCFGCTAGAGSSCSGALL